MPKRRDPLLTPREYVLNWPDGNNLGDTGIVKAGAPLPVHYMLEIARKARHAMAEQGLNGHDLTKMTNLERSTVRLVLNGYTWPDIVTVVRIEQVLGISLWPSYGDTALREAQEQIEALQDEIAAMKTRTRKRAAARAAETRAAGQPAAKKTAAGRAPGKKVAARKR